MNHKVKKVSLREGGYGVQYSCKSVPIGHSGWIPAHEKREKHSKEENDVTSAV